MVDGNKALGAAPLTACFRPVSRYTTAATFQLAKLMPGSHGSRDVYAMDIVQHPREDSIFATAGTDLLVSVLDLQKGVAVNTYQGHTDRINELCYSSANEDEVLINVFFSASEDGTVKIWDTRTPSPISSISIVPIGSGS